MKRSAFIYHVYHSEPIRISAAVALVAFAGAGCLIVYFREAWETALLMTAVGLVALAAIPIYLWKAAAYTAYWNATGDPSATAIEFAQEHSLDFTMDSLRTEVDRLLELPIFCRGVDRDQILTTGHELERNEAALSAYVGETVRRRYRGTWCGRFSPTSSFRNYYEFCVDVQGYHYWPSRFFFHKLDDGPDEGTFADRLDELLTEVQRPDRASNQFALALYGELRRQSGNVLFSPFSVRTTLAMAQAGACGETAREMGRVLSTSGRDDQSNPGAGIQRRAARSSDERDVAFANSLWYQQGASLRTEFRDVIAANYGGEAQEVDFQSDSNHVTAIINDWVKATTNGRILRLIPPGQLDRGTRRVNARVRPLLVCCNAAAASRERPRWPNIAGGLR